MWRTVRRSPPRPETRPARIPATHSAAELSAAAAPPGSTAAARSREQPMGAEASAGAERGSRGPRREGAGRLGAKVA